MLKLNNKGFAITGILYSLYALFLIILLSVLSSLKVRKNIIEDQTAVLEESYKGTLISNASAIDEVMTKKEATRAGKYIFELILENDSNHTKCYSYLKKGDKLHNSNDTTKMTFIPLDCNNYEYSFEEDSSRFMKLVGIYSFEE